MIDFIGWCLDECKKLYWQAVELTEHIPLKKKKKKSSNADLKQKHLLGVSFSIWLHGEADSG